MNEVLNRAQQLALCAYSQGMYRQLLLVRNEEELKEQLEVISDPVLTYLLVELSEKEDCDSVGMAFDRVVHLIQDVEVVKERLEQELTEMADLQIKLTLTTSSGQVGTQVLGRDEDMVWDSESDGETVRARFVVFRTDSDGLDKLIGFHVIDGDQWRQLDSEGDVDAVVTNVRGGMDLSRAIAKAAYAYTGTVSLAGAAN